MTKTLHVIDGYGVIYQSYFAFINRPLYNPEGNNSQAVFGFFRTLFEFLREYNPSDCVIVLDSKTKTFRHEKYPLYKAHRDKTPDELHAQIGVIEEILSAMHMPFLRVEGFEADDCIAALAVEGAKAGIGCRIVSRDKDVLQLVNTNVLVMRSSSKQSGYEIWDSAKVFEKIGVHPHQMIDYLALTGDQSDNIPGVTGIGPKTAVKLLEEHGTLENIYVHIDSIKAATQTKLAAGKENAFLSRELVTLACEVPLPAALDSFSIERLDVSAALPLFEKQGMKSIVQTFKSNKAPSTPEIAEVEESSAPLPSTAEGTYQAITDQQELAAIVKTIQDRKYFAFDTETDSIHEMEAEIIGISVALDKNKAWYIPIQSEGINCLTLETVLSILAPVFQDPEILLIGQNIKYDYKVMKRAGAVIKNKMFDTMIAAWLLDSEGQRSFSMDVLAEKYLSFKTIKYSDIIAKGSLFNLSHADLQQATDYAAEDADITFQLYRHFLPLLEKEGLDTIFHEIEMPVLAILAEMELAGIRVLPEKLKEQGSVFETRLKEIEEDIYKAAGHEFNINSPKQLQEVLFTERNLPPVKKTKTGFSTDNQVLEQLLLTCDDEIPPMIVEHRSLSKLKNTYLDTLPKIINPDTGKIHTQYMQTGTATGRLSSNNPNLQNIPVRADEGRRIRAAFVPGEDSLFISADYSQIELVVLAHLSKDPLLTKAFLEGTDVHALTASIIFHKDIDDVQPNERQMGKTVNFGVVYGMSAFRLARDFKISRTEADSFIDEYFLRYTGVQKFRDIVIADAVKKGFVTTLMGRKRTVRTINSANRTERNSGERIAFNTTIQGSAADIVKLAMIKIHNHLTSHDYASKLLLQVHDELILESPKKETKTVMTAVKNIMEKAVHLAVPLRVNIEAGESWGSIH
ncbi:MAG: DNA polymerase I [Spirochaetales bacterium]|nr:DNA polymerase I [Spirochaetales bacterium]